MGIAKKIKRFMNFFKEEKKVAIIQSVPEQSLLSGKTALITGGTGGIGRAIAEKLLSAGAKVVITGTNKKKLSACVKEINSEKLCGMQLNVADVSSLGSKVTEAIGMLNGKIDILVNCAGVITNSSFFDMTAEEYDKVMDINAKGTFFMSQAVSRHMIEKGIHGHILNLSSASALRPATTPYHMSKWAVRGLTVGLADILAQYGIVVNAIGPGPTATAMLGKNDNDSIYHATNPSGRFAVPEEIASLALFLVSQTGELIVGDTVYITGGAGITTLHG